MIWAQLQVEEAGHPCGRRWRRLAGGWPVVVVSNSIVEDVSTTSTFFSFVLGLAMPTFLGRPNGICTLLCAHRQPGE